MVTQTNPHAFRPRRLCNMFSINVPASTPSGLVLSLSLAELLTNCSACSAKLFCRSWLFACALCFKQCTEGARTFSS